MNPRVHRSRVTHDRWLVSYADFITLLFAFFVVLYAFAKADQKKQAEISIAIDSAFRSLGVLPDATRNPSDANQSMTSVNSVMSEEVLSPAKVKDDLENMRRELEKTLSSQIAHHAVSVQMGRDGLIISLREAGFFDSGSATPRPEMQNTLRQIVASVGRTPYDVRIEGHTDGRGNPNANQMLSQRRADSVRDALIAAGVAANRMTSIGLGEDQPVADNENEEGRAKNRRVDVILEDQPH